MRFHIIGAGPVGQLLATLLTEDGHDVCLIVRGTNQVTMRSITRFNSLESRHSFSISQKSWNQIVPGEIQFAIICTKASASMAAFDQLLPRPEKVLFLHNGMGPQQQAFNLAQMNTLWGSNTHGCYINKDQHLIHAGQGDIIIGSPGELQKPDELPHCFKWQSNIELILWKKLAINALINPVTLKYRCKNGALLQNHEALELMEKLADEIVSIASSQGITLDSPLKNALDVARATAQNWSSTMQDYFASRPTELAYISGYLVVVAQKNKIKIPAHVSLLKELSSVL